MKMFWCDVGGYLSNSNMSSSSRRGVIISAAASLVASAVLLRTVASDLLPDQLRSYLLSRLYTLSSKLSSQLTVVVDECNSLSPNYMFEAAILYLSSDILLTSPAASTLRIKANKDHNDSQLTFTLDINQQLTDRFNDAKLRWTLLTAAIPHNTSSSSKKAKNSRYFELTFHRKHRDMVLRCYLPYVLQRAAQIKLNNKQIKLYTVDYNGTDYWSGINLDHPSTFDTVAMDPHAKRALLDDLDRFRARKDYYKRVGKAWKRGYLLYGPPGTGKSSLVAAMANYLRFDLYDLDLKEVMCNSDLRRLLIGTASRSILVIEDIDCSAADVRSREGQLPHDTANRQPVDTDDEKVTLSGLLNFIDGLWSTCGDERIIVFTTNHKDRLDPALLRPGRMDIQIHMSYCDFSGFKILAANYLGIHDQEDHPQFKAIEELLSQTQVTPAEVAGELMKFDGVETTLQELVRYMKSKSGKDY